MDSKNEEKQLSKDEEIKALHRQLKIGLTYAAFVYGMASAGDPMAIKLVSLFADPEENLQYEISMKVKK